MAKKIYDIIPPDLAHKVEDTIRELSLVGNIKKKRKTSPIKKRKNEKRPPFLEIFIGGGILLVLLGIYFYNTLPKADIIISPVLEKVSFQEKIAIDASFDTINVPKKSIPARYLEIIKEGTEEFVATGSASNDGKATGSIKVYNKISPSAPLVLKVGTHFLSDSGKYFITLEKITIPAMQGKSAGSVIVKVQAEQSGEAYNIGSSKFSVPKLSGTSYYYTIWGESTSNMVGGYSGKVKKVTQDDINGAKDLLTKKLLNDAEQALKSNILKEEVLLEGATRGEIIEANANLKENTIAESFHESAKVKFTALVFKKQDIEQFARDYVVSKLSDGKNFLETSLSLNYKLDLVDLQGKKGVVSATLDGSTYYRMDFNSLIDSSRMQSSGEIKSIIESSYGDKISKIEINLWPFWVKKAPKNVDRIKVDFNFE